MKGCYALILYVDERQDVEIGDRCFCLEKGVYAYVGSALGGVYGRLNRHLRTFVRMTRRKHWHIDHLLPKSKLLYVVYCLSNERLECTIVKKLKDSGFSVVKGFGSSDCKSKCGGHLLYMGNELDRAIDCVKSALSSLGLECFFL